MPTDCQQAVSHSRSDDKTHFYSLGKTSALRILALLLSAHDWTLRC